MARVPRARELPRAWQTLPATGVDLTLLDISLPDGEGIELIPQLRRANPHTYCVVAAIFDDDEHILQAAIDTAVGIGGVYGG